MVNVALIIGLVLITLSSGALWYLFLKMKKRIDKMELTVRNLHMDTKISNVFSGNEDKSIHDLANDLFKETKRRFKLQSNSYSDIITELSRLEGIEDGLRDALIDFFEHMIVISYKEEKGPHFEHEISYLKKKIKVIAHRMMD